MKSAHQSSGQSPDDVLNELRILVAEAEKILGQATTENSDDGLGALRERLEQLRARFADTYADLRGKVVTGARRTDELIRDKPYESLAIAAGIGLLVGLLLNRRD